MATPGIIWLQELLRSLVASEPVRPSEESPKVSARDLQPNFPIISPITPLSTSSMQPNKNMVQLFKSTFYIHYYFLLLLQGQNANSDWPSKERLLAHIADMYGVVWQTLNLFGP